MRCLRDRVIPGEGFRVEILDVDEENRGRTVCSGKGGIESCGL